MHFVYFAQKKLERFYDFLVERTEEKTTRSTLKQIEAKVGVKGKGTLGSILARLGLASVEVEADVSASGEVSFSKEIVSEFTSVQKLKALLFKLDSEGSLADLNTHIETDSLPKVGTRVVFAIWLQTDTGKRPEAEIVKTGAAILSGGTNGYTVEIQASLEFMESENAWRRLQPKPRFIAGFGTLIGVDLETHLAEIDPIVFAYATEP